MHVCLCAEARLHLFPKLVTEDIPSEDVNTSGYLSDLLHLAMVESTAKLLLVEGTQNYWQMLDNQACLRWLQR